MVSSANCDFPSLQESQLQDFVLQHTRQPTDLPMLQQLEAQLGEKLLVWECWQTLLPQAGILISPLLTGGTLAQRLQEAAQAMPGRCWLYLQPMSHFLPLPCPNGQAQPMTVDPDCFSHSFYSPEFCCRYACSIDPPGLYLFDTPETLAQKCSLARETGFRGVIRPS